MTGRWIKCYKCATHIWLETSVDKALQESHQNFYCLWGHRQAFSHDRGIQGELDAMRRDRDRLVQNEARLVEEAAAAAAERKAAHNKRSALAYKGVATKIKKRVAGGACPCCNRHFRELERHMTTQHPDYPATPLVPKSDEVMQ